MNFIDELILKNRSSFSEKEDELAKYFRKTGINLTNKTLSDISYETNISESTIYNFVKKMGFQGFQDFKITVATRERPIEEKNNKLTAFTDIGPEDEACVVAQKVISANLHSMENLLLSINEEDLNEALFLIENAEMIHFFGLGASSIVAYDSFHKFHRSHLKCNYISDSHMQLTYSTKLDDTDCAFLFSHTGNTIEILEIAQILKERGVKTIGMTGDPNSKLIEFLDVAFTVYSEESASRSESLTARFLYLTLVDILYVCTMQRHKELNYKSLKGIRSAIASRRVK